MSLIRSEGKMSQVIDFTGIKKGKVHPTDIDAVLEFDNKFLILIEVKTKGNNITTGQRILMERLVDSWSGEGKKAISLLVTHNVKNHNEPVMLSDCDVDMYYTLSGWKDTKSLINVKQLLNSLANSWDIKKLKNIGEV